MSRYGIASEIAFSHTLPASFYTDINTFEEAKENIFAKTWNFVTEAEAVKKAGDLYPFILLKGVLNEPLVLTRDREGELHCFSNVCTHRGKIIVETARNQQKVLRCGYHGRCFNLKGQFKSMPAFEGVENFPSKEDHLASVSVKEWMGMIFVSIAPEMKFEELVLPIMNRLKWMPIENLVFESSGTKDYKLNANWGLYCDNYLEGFHIPFVHPSLNKAIEFEQYETETFAFSSLQIGYAKTGEPHFNIPSGQQDFGKKIYAYYFHLFPNLMLNFYPWGLSLNVVEPLSHSQTKICFRSYRFENAHFNRELNHLEATEMEDEQVVESVQVGIQSRFYQSGRFSVSMEKCVHHFHKLVDVFMSDVIK